MVAEYILAPDPLWDALKQIGVPAANGYVFTYVSGTRTYKATYKDPAGLIPNTNPIRLSSAGQAVIYWKIEEGTPLYTIRIFAASDVDGIPGQLIYETDNYPNTGAGGGGGSIITIYSNNENYFRNEQYSWWTHGTSFDNDTLPVGDTEIADSWFYRRDNTDATVIISQQEFIPGNDPPPDNPPYYLEYECTAAASDASNLIYQKFYSVQTLQDTLVTVSFWAKTRDPSSTSSVTIYVEQNFGDGGSVTPAPTTFNKVIDDTWTLYSETFTTPSIVGKTIGTDSYLGVGFQMQINQIIAIDITNVYFQPGNGTGVLFPYRTLNDQYNNILQDILLGGGDEEGTHIITMPASPDGRPEQILYDYLEESFFEPKTNLLIGWNFLTNPNQFGVVISSCDDGQYIADQTILLSDGNGIVSKSSGIGDPLRLSVLVTAKKFGIFQIIETINSLQIRETQISLSAQLEVSSTATMKMAVLGWSGTANAQARDCIQAWNALGSDPTLVAGWGYVTPPVDFTVTTSLLTVKQEAIDSGDTYTSYAVLIWCDGADLAVSDDIFFKEGALVQGINAAQAENLPFETVLRQCQRYFQKSYSYTANSYPIVTGETGTLSVSPLQIMDTQTIFPVSISGATTIRLSSALNQIQFYTEMWNTPLVNIYNPVTTTISSAHWNIVLSAGSITSGTLEVSATAANASTKGFEFVNNTNSVGLTLATVDYEPDLIFHYVADATLGV